MASVSKVIHTDNQLQTGQFGKAAYTGWIPGDGRFQIFNAIYGRYFPDESPARIFMHVELVPVV